VEGLYLVHTVLSAAHCFDGHSRFRVTLGKTGYKEGGLNVDVQNIIDHPDFKVQNRILIRDYAIVKLAKSVSFSNQMNPACLPDPTENYEKVEAIITGWGIINETTQENPKTLQLAKVITVNQDQCIKKYGKHQGTKAHKITPDMICAYAPDKDTCQRDSGGPLVANTGGFFAVIGVTSFGKGCAQPGYPGVYARVTSQLQWIKSHISGITCPKPIKNRMRQWIEWQ